MVRICTSGSPLPIAGHLAVKHRTTTIERLFAKIEKKRKMEELLF